MIDEELKAILACPACKGDLLFEETRIIGPAAETSLNELYRRPPRLTVVRRAAQPAPAKPAQPPRCLPPPPPATAPRRWPAPTPLDEGLNQTAAWLRKDPTARSTKT